jgi:hypothetical protein
LVALRRQLVEVRREQQERAKICLLQIHQYHVSERRGDCLRREVGEVETIHELDGVNSGWAVKNALKVGEQGGYGMQGVEKAKRARI